MHKTTDRFWKCFYMLPRNIQESAEESFELLKKNPRHSSLRFKKIGKFWSARVSSNHRALAVEDGEDFIWVWIGAHEKYERMLKLAD